MTNDPLQDVINDMRNANIPEREIQEYLKSLSDGDKPAVNTLRSITTFGISKSESVKKEIQIGSSLASSLDVPIPATDLLKEYKTQEALSRAIEARQNHTNEFDLAKGEKKR